MAQITARNAQWAHVFLLANGTSTSLSKATVVRVLMSALRDAFINTAALSAGMKSASNAETGILVTCAQTMQESRTAYASVKKITFMMPRRANVCPALRLVRHVFTKTCALPVLKSFSLIRECASNVIQNVRSVLELEFFHAQPVLTDTIYRRTLACALIPVRPV